ncbi:hypothetical protein BDZ89DRAFT_1081679 [Hymenopellis radicata]|nr:hypothetical protein BDZ89DRAFT_1081679 [Hymenopellis radicata]
MDAELERLRRENARLKEDMNQIITERNQYLSQIQEERTSKAELSSRNTRMSNKLLALGSEINDLKRTNQDLSEKLELALATADREPTASRASTFSSDRATPARTSKSIPRVSVSAEVPTLSKSKPRSSRATARKKTIVISDDEDESSVQAMKAEATSPTRAEEPPPQEGPNGLEESDNDDPFAHDFELLQVDLAPEKQSAISRSSVSGDDAVDALRTSGDLKRKHNDEEESEIEQSATPPTHAATASPPKSKWKAKVIDMKPYESISQQYLQAERHFAVTPPAQTDFFFSREQVNKSFGGQMYTFISTLKKASSLNGRPIKCVWPENDLNPLIVSHIGAPGLMFASRHEILHDPPWYVFSKRMVEGKARWEYCGSYQTTNVGNIEAEQFKGFPRNVQTRWGGLIAESMSRTQPVYVKMRVRIGLRKLGETVTESRVDSEADTIFKSKKGERKGVQVTSEDVIRALGAGEEHLNILRMRCVGYDHAFVDDLKRDIAASAADPGPAKKRQRELREMSSQEQVSGVRRSNRERKTRAVAHDELELSEDDW